MPDTDAAAILKLARATARLSASCEFFEDFTKRLAAVAGAREIGDVMIPGDVLTVAELAETLDRLAEIVEPIIGTVRRLDRALPKPN